MASSPIASQRPNPLLQHNAAGNEPASRESTTLHQVFTGSTALLQAFSESTALLWVQVCTGLLRGLQG